MLCTNPSPKFAILGQGLRKKASAEDNKAVGTGRCGQRDWQDKCFLITEVHHLDSDHIFCFGVNCQPTFSMDDNPKKERHLRKTPILRIP